VPAKSTRKKDRRLMLAALFVILTVGVAALLHAVTGWSTRAAARKLRNPVPASTEVIAAGMQTYRQHCQKCHGENGDGKGAKAAELSVAPGDFTDVGKMRDLTDGELFWEITKGRRPMPAFADKLSDQERWQVVDFIRTFAAPAGNGTSSQP
jgi:mono/diheme cytochrome c family protein